MCWKDFERADVVGSGRCECEWVGVRLLKVVLLYIYFVRGVLKNFKRVLKYLIFRSLANDLSS
jgi:hypothetical protein